VIIFPEIKLKPLFATIFQGALNKSSMEIHFAPFTVEEQFEDETFSHDFHEPIRADFIQFPSVNVLELQGKAFNFPLNPEEGYIDASVYFMNRHNPVDITKIAFDTLSQNHVSMTINTRWLMSLEGTATNDFNYNFTVPIRF